MKLSALTQKSSDPKEGFTLLELMVVVIIIGILAAISIPIFANQQKSAAEATVKSDLKNAALAIQTAATKTGGKYNSTALPADYKSTEGNVIQIKPVSSSNNLVGGGVSDEGLRAAPGYHVGNTGTNNVTVSTGSATYNNQTYGGPYWTITSPAGSIPAGTTLTVSIELETSVTSCFLNYIEQWKPDNTYGGHAGAQQQTCFEAGVPKTLSFTRTSTADAIRLTFVNYKMSNPGEVVKWKAATVVTSDTLDTDNLNASPDAKYCVQGFSAADPAKIYHYSSTTGKVKEGKC